MLSLSYSLLYKNGDCSSRVLLGNTITVLHFLTSIYNLFFVKTQDSNAKRTKDLIFTFNTNYFFYVYNGINIIF